MWKVTIHVGVYWEGYDYPLGTFRWRWLADLCARWELANHPWRLARIEKVA